MMTYLTGLNFLSALTGFTPGRWLLTSLFVGLFALTQLLPGTAMAQVPDARVVTVNINTADAATLAERLTGVGMSRAQEIVRYRESFGAFDSVDELADVKGIGPSTVDKNRSRIVLE